MELLGSIYIWRVLDGLGLILDRMWMKLCFESIFNLGERQRKTRRLSRQRGNKVIEEEPNIDGMKKWKKHD